MRLFPLAPLTATKITLHPEKWPVRLPPVLLHGKTLCYEIGGSVMRCLQLLGVRVNSGHWHHMWGWVAPGWDSIRTAIMDCSVVVWDILSVHERELMGLVLCVMLWDILSVHERKLMGWFFFCVVVWNMLCVWLIDFVHLSGGVWYMHSDKMDCGTVVWSVLSVH